MFIQPHRDPPLHVVCSDCGDSHHVRHYPHRGVFGGDTDWICPKCVAKDDPPLSESIPGEMLLSEDSDQPPASALPVTVPAPLPSHVDSSAEFDAKMDVYGMERSPTQPNTKPDGNCAVYGNIYINRSLKYFVLFSLKLFISAVLDQHCRNVYPPLFEESQHLLVRMRVAMAVGEAVFSGEWSPDSFPDKDVNAYMQKMSRNGVDVDMFFLIKLAQLIKTDIIIIYLHPETISEGDNFSPCVIIRGGPGDTFAENIPIFLGYFEECYYRVSKQ